MKYYLCAAVLGLAIGLAQASFAGMLDDENANKNNNVDSSVTGSSDPAATDTSGDVKEAGDGTAAENAQTTKEEQEAKAEAAERKKACGVAGDSKQSEGARAEAQRRCNEVAYDMKNPYSTGKALEDGKAYKELGDAHKGMLSGDLTKTDGTGFQTVDTKVGTPKATDTLLSNESLFNKGELTSNVGENATNVQTVDVDEKAQYNRYDPAMVQIGGTGSGMVRCSGGPACPGGKFGVDTGDGSYWTSLNQGRAQTFQTWEAPQTETGTLNKGFLVADNMPKGTTSDKLQVAAMLNNIGKSRGMTDEAIAVAIADVYRESSFKTNTGPGTTSAWGYGQYVGDTWLGSAKDGQGGVLNRNNSFNQANVMMKDVDQRWDAYAKSNTIFKTFGEYDYAIHHDGSIINGGQGNVATLQKYYYPNVNNGLKFADYALYRQGSGEGTVVAGKTSFLQPGTPTNNSGLGSTVQQLLGGGGNASNLVQSILGQTGMGGNSQISSIISMLNGQGGTGDIKQMMVAMVLQQLMGGSSGGSSSDGNSGKGTGNSGTVGGSKDSGGTRGYDAISKQKEKCGDELPKSLDAKMLMIKNCQEAA